MKFGKRMRSLAAAAWDADYVDYKQLKRLIKALAAEAAAQTTAVTTPNVEAHSDLDFMTAVQGEMARLNAAHARICSELEDRELRRLRDALGNRWVLSPAQARTLLLEAIELSERVDAFRRFIVLNSLALVKSAKKHDKCLAPAHTLKPTILEELKRQPFYDSAALDRLCAGTAVVTDRIMLCVLPDGNFRISQHQVPCPICLHHEVKSAITLSCRHTFCWSCLSKAAEHRFHSCPLCRKVQSIDPRDYAIDGLVMRFKRAYEFVEGALNRAPLASSPMRQILMEAFALVDHHLATIEAQYAALSPRPSVDGRGIQPLSVPVTADKPQALSAKDEEAQEAEVEPQPQPAFAKGDAVEVLYNGHWYPGMILHPNDDSASYSVLWWVKDNSQRCGQRMPRHLLRVPVFLNDEGQYSAAFLAEAWKTATAWALSPFRRLRSISLSEGNSSNTLGAA